MKEYDVIVIGAGHAGVEAALASARMGLNTLMLTMNVDSIGYMACNPSIGGTAKGHLVREIDALGGEMGLNADCTLLQLKMLNIGKGAAVHSLRAQSDKLAYHIRLKSIIESETNLHLIQDEACDFIFEENIICGVKGALKNYTANAVVIASGVYLNSRIIIGSFVKDSGPSGFYQATKLTGALQRLDIPLYRFKTGTPARVNARTVDFDLLEAQYGDEGIYNFSFLTETETLRNEPCYLTYTNEETHRIILDNIHRSPLYSGVIEGAGPRYCPSIETKIKRFQDKNRHQLFLEPDTAGEIYIQGLSTSMPVDVQDMMVHSIEGLKNAEIIRYGYAIEYDCINPLCLLPTLAIKNYSGLYTAGQINGSSGYEEAASQGLIAGINAALYVKGEKPFVLSRDEAYIGVLIDDLVTKGTEEPYRMMTSRCEHRISLRQDNADLRLTEKGRELGIVKDYRYTEYIKRLNEIVAIRDLSERTVLKGDALIALCSQCGEIAPNHIKLKDAMKRPGITRAAIIKHFDIFNNFNVHNVDTVWNEYKYEGYLRKEQDEIVRLKKLEAKIIPNDFDYNAIKGLRKESIEKLSKIRPMSVGQASRISGVSPADITVLILHL